MSRSLAEALERRKRYRLCFSQECAFREEYFKQCNVIEELQGEVARKDLEIQHLKSLVEGLSKLVEELTDPWRAALRFLSEELFSRGEVEEVYYMIRSDGVLDVWVLLKQYSPHVEEEICKVFSRFMRVFDRLHLDFMILPSDRREIVPPNYEKLPRSYGGG